MFRLRTCCSNFVGWSRPEHSHMTQHFCWPGRQTMWKRVKRCNNYWFYLNLQRTNLPQCRSREMWYIRISRIGDDVQATFLCNCTRQWLVGSVYDGSRTGPHVSQTQIYGFAFQRVALRAHKFYFRYPQCSIAHYSSFSAFLRLLLVWSRNWNELCTFCRFPVSNPQSNHIWKDFEAVPIVFDQSDLIADCVILRHSISATTSHSMLA